MPSTQQSCPRLTDCTHCDGARRPCGGSPGCDSVGYVRWRAAQPGVSGGGAQRRRPDAVLGRAVHAGRGLELSLHRWQHAADPHLPARGKEPRAGRDGHLRVLDHGAEFVLVGCADHDAGLDLAQPGFAVADRAGDGGAGLSGAAAAAGASGLAPQAAPLSVHRRRACRAGRSVRPASRRRWPLHPLRRGGCGA